jgi:hypothetical protein
MKVGVIARAAWFAIGTVGYNHKLTALVYEVVAPVIFG